MYWPRVLVLTDEPKLVYYKPNSGSNRDLQYIDLDFLCKVERVERTKFAVITPHPKDYKKK